MKESFDVFFRYHASIFFFCAAFWGSFLSGLGYRLVSFDFPFSHLSPFCYHCYVHLGWKDLIPLISYMCVNRACKICLVPFPLVHPVLECFTACIVYVLYVSQPHMSYFFMYFIFISALIVIIRSDYEAMLISQLTTLYMIPFGIGAAYCGWLPLNYLDACMGALSGYLFLLSISFGYTSYKKVVGIGEGDMEMLAMIGAFTGIIGWWVTITIASLLGSFIALYMNMSPKHSLKVKIPFGPFLAIGAILCVFFKDIFIHCLFF